MSIHRIDPDKLRLFNYIAENFDSDLLNPVVDGDTGDIIYINGVDSSWSTLYRTRFKYALYLDGQNEPLYVECDNVYDAPQRLIKYIPALRDEKIGVREVIKYVRHIKDGTWFEPQPNYSKDPAVKWIGPVAPMELRDFVDESKFIDNGYILEKTAPDLTEVSSPRLTNTDMRGILRERIFGHIVGTYTRVNPISCVYSFDISYHLPLGDGGNVYILKEITVKAATAEEAIQSVVKDNPNCVISSVILTSDTNREYLTFDVTFETGEKTEIYARSMAEALDAIKSNYNFAIRSIARRK